MAEILIKVGGVFSLAFAIFHALFWRIFNWKNDLRSLTWMNRSIMQVLNLCLMFAFIIFAYVSLFHTYEMLSMPLGKTLLVLIALFWLARAIEQVVFF
ncbi:hypothetical protein GWN91_07695, partial [Candidatus Saccharibacteria bacterium]|nr:hypothetical protein [Candidatus Saccharibacteria bacterium]NIV03820.1 hypothetical protein [Calditrichia bacterium]NIV72975.1 hypothetical protein [Calditrichia bacterium]NIW79312.1 hypothetical protein [Calditrichia bacterium]